MKKLYLFIFILLMAGCATNNNEQPLTPLEIELDFKSSPPENLYDLLHREGATLAYKSVTKKDYEAKDEC